MNRNALLAIIAVVVIIAVALFVFTHRQQPMER